MGMGLSMGSIVIANSECWVKVSDRPRARQWRASAGAKRGGHRYKAGVPQAQGWHKGGTPGHMGGEVVARLHWAKNRYLESLFSGIFRQTISSGSYKVARVG